MSNQIPLLQVFLNTVSKMLAHVGLDRQLMIDTETYRLYVHDGVTKGGHPLKKLDDPTEEIRTIKFKGPDPVAGETWVMGEWPSDDDPLVKIPAYIAGAVGGGVGNFNLINQGDSGVAEITLIESDFEGGKKPYILAAAIGPSDTLTINLPDLSAAVIGSELYIHHVANVLGTVNVVAGEGVTFTYESSITTRGNGLLIMRLVGVVDLGPSGMAKFWSSNFELKTLIPEMADDDIAEGTSEVSALPNPKQLAGLGGFDPLKTTLVYSGNTTAGVNISAHGAGFYKVWNFSSAYALLYWDGVGENSHENSGYKTYIQSSGMARASTNSTQSSIYKIEKLG